MLTVHVRQSSHLERLGHLEQRSDLLLAHVNLTLVHELDDGLELRPLDVLEDHYRVLARVVEEERLEVGTAGGQHHLVRLDGVAVAGECDVDEGLALEELVEDVGQVGLVVVPSETELLRRAGARPGPVVVHAATRDARVSRLDVGYTTRRVRDSVHRSNGAARLTHTRPPHHTTVSARQKVDFPVSPPPAPSSTTATTLFIYIKCTCNTGV